MKPNKIPLYVWFACLAVVLLSGFSIRKRTEVEASNRSVAIAAEFETIEALSAGQGIPISQALASLKLQGLRALALNEETIADLVLAGRVSLIGQEPNAGSARGLALKFQDLSMVDRVKRGLGIRFGADPTTFILDGDVLRLPAASALQIRSTPVGLNPYQVANAKQAGMEVVGRYANTPGVSSAAIAQTLDWAQSQGVAVYLPLGDEVLGFRASLDQTLEDLHQTGILYASIEFGKIAGDTQVVEKGKDIVVRLHSAQTAELDKLTPFDATDRYVKAARERNMRLLLVRPLSLAGERPVQEYGAFLQSISHQVVKNGQSLGRPHPFREPKLSKFFFPILSLAIAPVVFFVASSFVTNRRVRVAGALVLGLVVLASVTKIGQEASALLGSVSFPILGFLVLDAYLSKSTRRGLLQVLTGYWLVCGISLIGGLCVAGMLNSLSFYIHASEMQAVKVSVFLPIVAVGLHYFVTLTNWKRALESPITLAKIGVGLAVCLAVGVMLARTGNDTGVGPSDGELVFRSLLDRFLYVRPRTKEFLVGHPALIIGIGMLGQVLGRKRDSEASDALESPLRGWTALALMVGAIGQSSLVNTLCHIHIPFFLSLIRDVEGMALGCIIGVVLWVVVKRLLPDGE